MSTTFPLPEPFAAGAHQLRGRRRLARAFAQGADEQGDQRAHHHRGRRGGRRPGDVDGRGPSVDPRPGFGPFAAYGPGGPRRRGGGRRGGRGGRGDVRAAVLLLLAEQPMHGYQLIQQIVERSEGVWTPSPGSVYPALAQLEDEGLLTFDRVEGRKTASLTDDGRTYVEQHRADLGSPWDDVSGGTSHESRALREEIGALMGAAHQVSSVGSRAQVGRAVDVLAQARRALYRLLAEDDSSAGGSAEAGDRPEG